MSLLGFVSGVLVSNKDRDHEAFLAARLTRFYSPLWLCLGLVVILPSLQRKEVLHQHLLLHAMGLSGFFELFGVRNMATVGAGLWFVTVIIVMYLVLPLLRRLFVHPRALAHLILLVVVCTVFEFRMYGRASTWNVVISFSLGAYVAVTDRAERLREYGAVRALPWALGVLALAALATAGVLPYALRRLLFAFYPLAFVPVFCGIARRLPGPVNAVVGGFAALSYEFYILHFYFLDVSWVPGRMAGGSVALQTLAAFAVTTAVAYGVSRIATRSRRAMLGYLRAT